LTFTDHKGVKTVLPSATVNGSGEYSLETTVPAEAVEGAGKVNAKSTLTSVSITKTFTVTRGQAGRRPALSCLRGARDGAPPK
jgi:hypothetical protein